MRICLTSCLMLSLAACATTAETPVGMEAGKFVTFNCDKGSFQARWDAEGKTGARPFSAWCRRAFASS
jgi:hypothetical protein